MHTILFLSQSVPKTTDTNKKYFHLLTLWICFVFITLVLFATPCFGVGIDESLLTKKTGPTLTFGIMPGYTLAGSSITLSGGLYNFLKAYPDQEIIIERSVEYAPYDQIAALRTGDDGTFLYVDTPPGRAEHKVYYRAVYVEGDRRIIETEPIFLYLGTSDTISSYHPESNSELQSQIQVEAMGYRFLVDSVIPEEETEETEEMISVTVFVSTGLSISASGFLLASPCDTDVEMLAIGVPGSNGMIHFPMLQGCSDAYMLCPVFDGEIDACTKPFSFVHEEQEEEQKDSSQSGRAPVLSGWLAGSQFAELMPNTSSPDPSEVVREVREIEKVDEISTPDNIGDKPIVLTLRQIQGSQRGIPAQVEVIATSADGTPLSNADISLFLSSDLVYWYIAAQNTTDETGIALFHVDVDRLATVKVRAAFNGDKTFSSGQSNTIVVTAGG